MLASDGIDLANKSKVAEATAKGGYRKLVQRASQLKWETVEKGEDQSVRAARLTFELNSGCYATSMLRELMTTTMTRDTTAAGLV